MAYQYGVTFNCYVERDVLGGGDECSNVEWVSSSMDKLIAHTIKENGDEFVFSTEHEYVGRETNVGGSIIGVFLEDAGTDDEYAVAALIEWPTCPDVIE